ncbi:hypothetical protein AAF712_004943 [Marasmius tenuissimus]|uniref:Uncharacterized protein n=1 Tax=Marasmius tenuissimus TaxID=585030 RepID=A0ABR3A264_9AGAR
MDSTTTSTTSRPQQRSSPANNDRDHSPSQHQQHLQHQQVPYSFQQQPQGQWAPSISAQPFYPSFYQNPQQNSPAGFPQQAPPYFDPAQNPQLAQWAYQQMMFNAQQSFMPPGSSRGSPSSSNPNDYFAQSQMGAMGNHGMFNPFPSGTPPPPQHQQNGGGQQQPYPGFHPYRRPARQGSTNSQGSLSFPESSGSGNNEWRPPYARPEASGSTSSVNSTHSQRQRTDSNQSGRGSQHGHGSANGSVRGRPSGGGSPVGGGSSSSSNKHSQSSPHSHPRQQQPQQHQSHSPSHSGSASKNLPHPNPPHHRNLSASSNASSSSAVRSTSVSAGTSSQSNSAAPSPSSSSAPGSAPSTSPSSPGASSTTSHNSTPSVSSTTSTVPRPARPSPLSQGTTSFHVSSSEKRMSRDDADLAAMMREDASDRHKSGLKGRLRRALTFGTVTSPAGIHEENEPVDDDDESIKASRLAKPKSSNLGRPSTDTGVSEESGNTIQTAASTTLNPSPSNFSTASTSTSPGPPPAQKKRGRAASLFNSRLNASTDNISLSSTVSSASVMIRKLGSMGKLARRNSLAGITSLFKDKKKKDDTLAEEDDTGPSSSDAGGKEDKKKKKKKEKEKEKDKKGSTAKATVSEASVSHVTAELDRGSASGEWNAAELAGLSPAAKLARQHTLKTNAEAAAKERERLQKEKEEKEREAAAAALKANGVNGAGGVPAWERGTHNRSPVKGGGNVRVNEDGTRVVVEEDDEEDWSEDGHRRPQTQQTYQPGGPEGWDDDGDDDDWDGEDEEDVTIRMGVDRIDLNNPTAGNAGGDWAGETTWKNAVNYDQHNYLVDSAHNQQTRVRANSYDAHPSQQNELGPLARIPSPDPDHIDGLHRHGSHSSGGHHAPQQPQPGAPFLPPLSFDSSPIKSSMDAPQKPPANSGTMFSHSNSSAPALSLTSNANPPTLTHRSATAPSKRLAFANNLSVYDTFSASVYDRRSEPATWSRLTPALAQRIKEELNSFKMEEMEVHAASRVHTQFFV